MHKKLPCRKVLITISKFNQSSMFDKLNWRWLHARNVTSDWFMVKSGVKQGCVISEFHFFLCLDWVMRKATADKRRGIRMNFTTVLEDLEFAEDIALLSSKFNDLHEKTGRLVEEAARVGLKLNARKCKTLRTECASSREKIVVDGEKVDDLEEFTYLGATVNKEGGGSKDIMQHLQKARGTFQRLLRVWAARGIGRRTKIDGYCRLEGSREWQTREWLSWLRSMT